MYLLNNVEFFICVLRKVGDYARKCRVFRMVEWEELENVCKNLKYLSFFL